MSMQKKKNNNNNNKKISPYPIVLCRVGGVFEVSFTSSFGSSSLSLSAFCTLLISLLKISNMSMTFFSSRYFLPYHTSSVVASYLQSTALILLWGLSHEIINYTVKVAP